MRFAGSFPCPVEIRTDDPEGCPAFYGRVVRGTGTFLVEPAPGGAWLRWAVAGDDQLALRDRALLETLYAAGLRVSEATALDVDDLDLEDGTVRAFGKGAKERLVPIGRSARRALEAYLVRARPLQRCGATDCAGGRRVGDSFQVCTLPGRIRQGVSSGTTSLAAPSRRSPCSSAR